MNIEKFADRHIGTSDKDVNDMLTFLSLQSLDELIERVLPTKVKSSQLPQLPQAVSEFDLLTELQQIASKNKLLHSMIGMGYHETILPPVIQRNVLENPGWYTAYTPYQAEISQGRLEGLLTFQHMICDLTAMDMANASLLDESTAAAEAITLCRRVSNNKGNSIFVDEQCLPQTLSVLHTRCDPLGIEIITGNPDNYPSNSDIFATLIQYPGRNGNVPKLADYCTWSHQQDAMVVVCADLMALAMLEAPGELGADVVVGNSQRFGVPMGHGGPHAAFIATKMDFRRAMPGRIIGVSKDSHGNKALRMALQVREQHIRRAKATSNICTAQSLPALLAAFYTIYHGSSGILQIAQTIHELTGLLAEGLTQLGFEAEYQNYFDTLSYVLPREKCQYIKNHARVSNINVRVEDNERVVISINEATRPHHINTLLRIFHHSLEQPTLPLPNCTTLTSTDIDFSSCGIPKNMARQTVFLQHQLFNDYRSETAITRYLNRLQNYDLALDRTMIPLGSCTMKLNATTEMMPITWPAFSSLHPFCPTTQDSGSRQIYNELEGMLMAITGHAGVSLQPNAGSQGEYAGLLAIQRYFASLSMTERDICLIPSSAHGTNPASAIMVGFEVVEVRCDDQGSVDMQHIQELVTKYDQRIAALMITYPSTHGVFETEICAICDLIHSVGGQVYMDGANLNAMVAVAYPANLGADVCHINLHKTFCIPHGGGGPGAGPITVAKHLVPFLPSHCLDDENEDSGITSSSLTNGAVSAAPWGNGSILIISWAYIRLMGAEGLRRATSVAILHANYIAKRLAPITPYYSPVPMVGLPMNVSLIPEVLRSLQGLPKKILPNV